MRSLNKFRPCQPLDICNPIVSPELMAAAQRLKPCPDEARLFSALIRVGRVTDALALAERITVEAAQHD